MQNSELDENQVEITAELLALEKHFTKVLNPISEMKKSKPEVYWFVVSWMGTNYNTPNWKGYGKEGWKAKAKKEGIDCSGFARVMLDEVFSRKIKGGSQGILNKYCKPVSEHELEMGDLVFFHAPYSKNTKIVHVGVYLENGYFVHATSKRSAAQGLGLNINNLSEENWSQEFVIGGKVKK